MLTTCCPAVTWSPTFTWTAVTRPLLRKVTSACPSRSTGPTSEIVWVIGPRAAGAVT